MWRWFIGALLFLSSVAHAQQAIPLTLTWSDQSNNEERFEIERRADGGSYLLLTTVGADVQTYRDMQVMPGVVYTYRVRAWNGAGYSVYSNEASRLAQDESSPLMPGVPALQWVANDASLVLAFDFELSDMNETTVLDKSGQRNHGLLTNGVLWTTAGRFGAAAVFDGTNDRVVVADAPTLDLTTAMTLSAWVYPTTTAGASVWRTVLLKERTGGLVYGLYANNAVHRPSASLSVFGGQSAQGAALPTYTWTHLAATYDGNALRLYVNGVPQSVRLVTGALGMSSQPLYVGGNALWGEHFQGRIDQVRVYRRALSQEEIQTSAILP